MATTTETQAERDARTIAKYEQDLLSGAVFARAASGQRSYIGYRPPTNRRDFADLVTRLGNLASESDERAQIAHAILGKLHLYGCKEELLASAYEAAAEAVRKQYTDVIGLASPEPPRYSAATRGYHLLALLDVGRAIDNREGWCAAALRERESRTVRWVNI